MVIQIERISAQSIHRAIYRCAEAQCGATATWTLVDLGMPNWDAPNMGQRQCCVDHISAAYLSLRGARLIAQALGKSGTSRSRAIIDQRRRRARRSIRNLSAVLARGVG
jgi:hypothetical protein